VEGRAANCRLQRAAWMQQLGVLHICSKKR
jgi:hypothetical protein